MLGFKKAYGSKTSARGVNRTVFTTLKVTIPCTRQRKLCVFRLKKLSKTSLIFWKKSFYHSFGTLCWSTSLFTFTSSRAFSVAWQLLAARSPCCAVLIFVDRAFLSGMNARWKFIFDFLPRAIDTTCVHTQSWLWSSPLQANKFSSSMIHFLMRQLLQYVFDKEGFAFAPPVTK